METLTGGRASEAGAGPDPSWRALYRASWIIVQVLSLGPSIVAMVVFLALLMALKQLNKSYAAIGAVIALTSQELILVRLIAVGWKLSRLGTQRGSLLSPSNSVQL